MKKIIILLLLLSLTMTIYALDQTITVPAEKPEGVSLMLPMGTYIAEVSGGALALFFPISPEYSWLYSLAIGTDCKGAQDEPNIGTLYVEPQPKATSQADAEKAILQALKEGQTGTKLEFTLKEKKEVRFWVSDFDYSDNMGSERIRVYLLK